VILPGAPTSAAAIIAKVAADQLINSPLGTCLFFAWNNCLQGTPGQIVPDLHSKLWTTTKAGACCCRSLRTAILVPCSCSPTSAPPACAW